MLTHRPFFWPAWYCEIKKMAYTRIHGIEFRYRGPLHRDTTYTRWKKAGCWFKWDFIGPNQGKLPITARYKDTFEDLAIVTNPPFKHWLEFAVKALEYSNEVCLFGMLNYLSGIKRYNQLFSVNPPQLIMVFPKRVEFSNGSNFYDFCWYIWNDELKQQNDGRTIIEWINPDQLDFKQYKLWSKQ